MTSGQRFEMTREELKRTILATMAKVAKQQEVKLVNDLGDDTILLESGLDSLGFAILVAMLELDLGFDAFADADVAYYPRTLADFVDFYLKGLPK